MAYFSKEHRTHTHTNGAHSFMEAPIDIDSEQLIEHVVMHHTPEIRIDTIVLCVCCVLCAVCANGRE